MIAARVADWLGPDISTPAARALVEENYSSIRAQTPIIYLLGLVNMSAMEIASTGKLAIGANVPTFIVLCAVLRLSQWYGRVKSKKPEHHVMAKRLRQTVWFAILVCLAVCARCVYLLQTGDVASHMAVILFGGLTALGVAYGLTALPIAGLVPLVLIIGPISLAAMMSDEPRFKGAAFGLVVVAVLTARVLRTHSRHLTTVIRSRSIIAREQKLMEHARQNAIVAATTDFLTGLPNRRAFVAALDAAVSENGEPFAVGILDLNRFKAVNDTFGHIIGDELLKEVARRLVAAVDQRGVVARLGGDEFGLLLPGVNSVRTADAVGSEVLDHVNGPAFLNGREFVISVSCGLGVSRKRKDPSPSRMMADADLALYQAKDGAGLAVFEAAMEAPRRRRSQIERALQLPGVHDQLQVVFQPIFDLKSGRVIANEALARWTDPELGSVPPSEFVPIAEHLNLINDINGHLMSLAFVAARSWPENIKIAFNLSAIQLCSRGSAEAVLSAMQRAGLSPGRLEAEVTETALLVDFERARENLAKLRDAGVTIVLDDFGAGYASISYLRELRFDKIKLDGGLVTAAQHSEDGKRLLRAVTGLCEILGVSTVAEHVETRELLQLVTELGCTAGQGFSLGRPVPSHALKRFIGTNILPLPTRGGRRAA